MLKRVQGEYYQETIYGSPFAPQGGNLLSGRPAKHLTRSDESPVKRASVSQPLAPPRFESMN